MEEGERLGLLWEWDAEHERIMGAGRGRIVGRFLRVSAAEALRNPNYTDADEWAALDDCQVSASVDLDGRDVYAFDVEYARPGWVDLRRAEQIVKVLRKVHRGLERLCAAEGPSGTFHAYAVRVARLLKVKLFLFEQHHAGSSYADNEYQILSVGDGMCRLASIIETRLEQHAAGTSAA